VSPFNYTKENTSHYHFATTAGFLNALPDVVNSYFSSYLLTIFIFPNYLSGNKLQYCCSKHLSKNNDS